MTHNFMAAVSTEYVVVQVVVLLRVQSMGLNPYKLERVEFEAS